MGGAVEDAWDGLSDIATDIWHAAIDGVQDIIGSLLGIEEPDLSQFDGTLLTKQGAVSFLPTVYGTRRLGGVQLFMGASGASNEFLWLVYALCESPAASPITSVQEIWLGDKLSTDASFTGYVTTWVADGTQTVNPFPDLAAAVPEWTTDSIGIDTAMVCIRLKWDQENGPLKSVPKVSFLVQGLEVVNVATQISAFSTNPADIVFDYLTNKVYGKGLANPMDVAETRIELDLQSFIDSRAYCDELVTLYDLVTGPRFSLDMVANAGGSILENLKIMLQSCRGNLLFKNGRYYLQIEKHYLPSELGLSSEYIALYGSNYFDFNIDNIIGGWKLSYGDVSKRYNRVKVTYSNEDKGYKSDFVVVEDNLVRQVDDNYELLETQVGFPAITNFARALDMAWVFLKKSRKQIAVTFTAAPEAFCVNVGDIVTVSHPTTGWELKQFAVVKVKVKKNALISVSLVEHDSAFYDRQPAAAYVIAPDTNLGDVTQVEIITGLSATSGDAELVKLSDGSILSRIKFSWTASTSVFVSHYELRYKQTLASDWLYLPNVQAGLSTFAYIDNVLDGIGYDMEIRASNSAGFYSLWASLSHTVIGKLALPSDVTGLQQVIISGVVTLTWGRVADKDLSDYEIRVGGTDWASSILVAHTKSTDLVLNTILTGVNTYRVKAVDTTGNYSALDAQISIDISVPAAIGASFLASVTNGIYSFSWAKPASVLPIVGYKLTRGVSRVEIITTDSDSYSLSADWQGDETFYISAINSVGQESVETSLTITTTAPSSLVTFTSQVVEGSFILSWAEPTTLLPIAAYKLTKGVDRTEVITTSATSHSVVADWQGDETFYISAINSVGQESVETSLGLSTTRPSTIASTTVTFSEGLVNISWSAPASLLPISKYTLTKGVARAVVTDTSSTTHSVSPDWVGVEALYLTSTNSAGQVSLELAVPVDVVVPNAPTVAAHTIASSRVEFGWSYPAGTNDYVGSLDIASYDIRYDDGTGTFGAATKILTTGTDAFSRKVDWVNNRRFWVAAIDVAGNLGTATTTTVQIQAPSAINIIPQVIDNNVLLRWDSAAQTLPVDYYEVRRGATYATSELVGSISGLFLTLFETVSGDYTYWITGVDTAGNYGVNNSITAAVSEPPDYVLYSTATDDFSGTKTNVLLTSGNTLNLPVNTTETFDQHHNVNNTFATPDAQIAAGFPVYIQPTPVTAQYVRNFDLGVVLNSLSVTFNIDSQTIAGDLIKSTTAPSRWNAFVSLSIDNITFIDYPINSLKVFSDSFRYMRLTIDVVTDSGDDLLEISNINYVIDVKEKSDSGTASALSTDISGTVVTFNKTFSDISSIVVTPTFDTAGGDTVANVTAIYDFEDVPNPTQFLVLLYDAAGARVSGKFTWNARGR